MKKLFVIATMVMGLAGVSKAQLNANAGAEIQANLLKGLTMTVSGSVGFGNVAITSGTVNSTSEATFTVTGTAGANIQITNMPTTVTLGDSSSGANGSITFSPTLTASTTTTPTSTDANTSTSYQLQGSFPGSGNYYFTLSGSITLTGNEAAGLYKGTYTLTVAYQ